MANVRGRIQFMGGNMKIRIGLRSTVVRASVIGVLIATTGVVPLSSVGAATNAYYFGSGYDASYPQGTSTPPTGNFAIIGVDHGRPFTTNQYAGTQWGFAITATNGSPSLYFNTGYALAYAQSDTGSCTTASASYNPVASGHTLSELQAAWAIGCSEASWAVSLEPAGAPTMWWADIETGNSWSKNPALNQATILGMANEIETSTSVPFGIYSTPSMWTSITGTGFVVPGVAGDWQAALPKGCPSTAVGFTLTGTASTSSYAPLLVAQTGTTTVSGGTKYDVDAAC